MNNQVIKFQDIPADLEEAAKRDDLNKLLYNQPRAEWVLRHKLIKVKNAEGQMVPLKYIPAYKIRLLMTTIFQVWRREVKEVKQVVNSCVAIVRVHYKDRITGEWYWQDGVGAAPLQLDADAAPNDSSAIKNNAVQLAAPSAVTYAFKQACEMIGPIFGGELNNYNFVDFVPMYSSKKPEPENNTGSNNLETKSFDEITTNF